MDKLKIYVIVNGGRLLETKPNEFKGMQELVFHADYAKLEAVKDAWKRWALAFHEYGKAELAGVSGKGMVPVLEEIESAEQALTALGELP